MNTTYKNIYYKVETMTLTNEPITVNHDTLKEARKFCKQQPNPCKIKSVSVTEKEISLTPRKEVEVEQEVVIEPTEERSV